MVNVGSVVVGGKLVAVSGETRWPDEKQDAEDADAGEYTSRALHLEPTLDPETGYKQPKQIKFSWTAPLLEGEEANNKDQKISSALSVDVGSPESTKRLLEKVLSSSSFPTSRSS